MRHHVLLWVFLMAVVGCKDDLPPKLEPGQTVTLKGEIASGAECPMLIVTGGRRFSLGGDLGRFRPGDRVCVHGTVAAMSICMEGEGNIALQSIAPEDSCR
ncbi:MAG TPA: DUF5818 domain-containing protein [Candidatus Eisenbacteria bacterium]|nr:DUF5818 domain-containing protein [Candidatus Eisenbacteria bacterium]